MAAEMQELKFELRSLQVRDIDRESEVNPRYMQHRVFIEIRNLLDNAEKYLTEKEYKRAYDSVNSAQRKIDRAKSDLRLSPARHDELMRFAARARSIESYMSSLPDSQPTNPMNRSGG